MNEVIQLKKSIRQQAEEEVAKELATKALAQMKCKLRDLAASKAVVAGIELQIADLEQQIADGTL